MKVFLLMGLFFNVLILSLWAEEENQLVYYLSREGSYLETLEGHRLTDQHFMMIEEDSSWAYKLRVYDRVSGQQLFNGQLLTTAKRYFDPSTKILDAEQVITLLKEVEGASPEAELFLAMRGCCPEGKGDSSSTSGLAELGSGTLVTSSADLKNQRELDSYFSCYQKKSKYQKRYTTGIKASIGRAVERYVQVMPKSLEMAEDEVKALFSCLIFRESAGWQGKSSPTGARGLGQFTTRTLKHLKKMLATKVEPNENIQKEVEKYRGLLARAKTKRERRRYRKDIEYLENRLRTNHRARVMQEYWRSLGKRPALRQLNTTYVSLPGNHSVVMALSMLLIMDCQMTHQQNNLRLRGRKSFFACTGGYNMGTQGFYVHALRGGEGLQSMGTWIRNLERSRSGQKWETKKHIISVKRCAEKGKNFPMCGTQANYCQGKLPRANICQEDPSLLCESKECS